MQSHSLGAQLSAASAADRHESPPVAGYKLSTDLLYLALPLMSQVPERGGLPVRLRRVTGKSRKGRFMLLQLRSHQMADHVVRKGCSDEGGCSNQLSLGPSRSE
jgi:hypothetical protein